VGGRLQSAGFRPGLGPPVGQTWQVRGNDPQKRLAPLTRQTSGFSKKVENLAAASLTSRAAISAESASGSASS